MSDCKNTNYSARKKQHASNILFIKGLELLFVSFDTQKGIPGLQTLLWTFGELAAHCSASSLNFRFLTRVVELKFYPNFCSFFSS